MAEIEEAFCGAGESLESAAGEMGTVEEGLSSEESQIMDSIDKSTEDLAKVSEDELAQLKDPDANFKDFTEKPEFKDGEDSANLDKKEMEDTDATEEEAKGLKEKFKAKIKTLLPKLGGWLESQAGKIIMEAIGSYFKYKFIVDETKAVAKDVDTIAKDIVSKGKSSTTKMTPEQKQTETKLESFLTVVSAMMKMGCALNQTLKNASGFTTSGDMNTPGTGANIAMQMRGLDLVHVTSQTKKAMDATSSMLTSIQGALKQLGYTKGESTSAIVKSVLANPTLLKDAVADIDISKVKDFKTEVSQFVETTQKVIQGPVYKGDKKDQKTMELFFRINPGWKKAEEALEKAISGTG